MNAEKVLDALILQVKLDREQSAYWRDRWTYNQGEEIEAWLSSLIDFGWPAVLDSEVSR